jgi:peroxiredoxin
MGVARVTFLIGKSGTVEKVWPAVSVEGHGADVLACVL